MSRLNPWRRWATLAAIVWAGESIYLLPYTLRRDYRLPLIDALQLDGEAALGEVYSVFGALALGAYLAGGWVADRFSPRVLLPFSLVSTAIGGLGLAAFPQGAALYAVFFLWAFSTILTFWAALIKATRAWGGEGAQGTGFGILEAGRGFVTASMATVGLQLFTLFADEQGGLRAVILLYVAAALLGAGLTWSFVEDPEDEGEQAESSALERLGDVARRPNVRLLAGIIFFGYSAYYGTYYMSSFATVGYGQTSAGGAAVSVTATWLRPVAPLLAGLAADRFSARSVVLVGFTGLIVAFTGLTVVTPDAANLPWLYAGALTVAGCTFALRGVFYALLAEGGLPPALTGTAVGVVSIIGYAPDMITPYAWGRLLEAVPGGAGYRWLMGSLALGSLIGLGLAALHRHRRAS